MPAFTGKVGGIMNEFGFVSHAGGILGVGSQDEGWLHGEERGIVLVIDHDAGARALISKALREAGWQTFETESRAGAFARIALGGISAVTLEIDLTAESGYDICVELRTQSAVPMIFVTTRLDDFDHVQALNVGGDAYVTKPFNPRVLVAEVAAAQRRSGGEGSEHVIQLGPVTIDPGGRRVTIGDDVVPLSKTEFDLLASLVAQPGRACTRQSLLDTVWGPWFGDLRVVEVAIGRLRKKLAASGAPSLIGTVPGVGYRINDRPINVGL